MPFPSGFRYRRTISLSVTGQANQPVKLALTSSNMSFSLANSDGSDLRVYDRTGDALVPIVIAIISDDGTNFVFTAKYADDGTSIGSASIAKSSVKAFSSGRVVMGGDLWTNTNGYGTFYRYVAIRPYFSSDPTATLGNQSIDPGLLRRAPIGVINWR